MLPNNIAIVQDDYVSATESWEHQQSPPNVQVYEPLTPENQYDVQSIGVQQLSSQPIRLYEPLTPEYQYESQRNRPESVIVANPSKPNTTTSTKNSLVDGAMKEPKAKRSRTAYTGDQLIGLEQEFAEQHYVNSLRRSEMARELKLSERQIKIWFQNRRMKFKREQCAPTSETTTGRTRRRLIAGGNNKTSALLQQKSSTMQHCTMQHSGTMSVTGVTMPPPPPTHHYIENSWTPQTTNMPPQYPSSYQHHNSQQSIRSVHDWVYDQQKPYNNDGYNNIQQNYYQYNPCAVVNNSENQYDLYSQNYQQSWAYSNGSPTGGLQASPDSTSTWFPHLEQTSINDEEYNYNCTNDMITNYTTLE